MLPLFVQMVIFLFSIHPRVVHFIVVVLQLVLMLVEPVLDLLKLGHVLMVDLVDPVMVLVIHSLHLVVVRLDHVLVLVVEIVQLMVEVF